MYRYKRAGGGVMDGFIKLYGEIYKDLYKIAYYYMGNRAEAEDAVSDAVLKAYENFSSLKNPEAFKTWIIRILINCCKKRMRVWFRKNSELENDALSYNPDYSIRPALEAAYKELSKEERLIVALYVFGGYKGEEIAKLLNMKHSTVRSKYHRALLKMKKILEA